MNKTIRSAIKVFTVTVFVTFIATNKENWVYKLLDLLGMDNEIGKKAILSALITLLVVILSAVISVIHDKFSVLTQKMELQIDIKTSDTTAKVLTFHPVKKEYQKQHINIEILLKPKGKITNAIIKKLGIRLEIYFNPEILDVYYCDKWDSQTIESFELKQRTILIDLFKQVKISGQEFNGKPHTLNEKFILKPIRIKDANTTLDYMIVSSFGPIVAKFASKMLLDVSSKKKIKIICKEMIS